MARRSQPVVHEAYGGKFSLSFQEQGSYGLVQEVGILESRAQIQNPVEDG
jgi:hypothetical protein